MIFRSVSTLRQFVGQYALERGLSARSVQALHHVINSFEKHLGRTAVVRDFKFLRINAWLSDQLIAGLDPETVRGRRTAIVGLWNHALAVGLIRRIPARIMKIKVADKPPVAWHTSGLVRLLKAAKSLPGKMNRNRTVRRRDFWAAYILVAYDIGVRLGDLLALKTSDISPSGAALRIDPKAKP